MPPDVALYDTGPLAATLQRLVDFDLLNRAAVPLLATAVDVETGQGVVFDSRKQRLEPMHFLASTAYAPVFPPVEIEGRCYVDPAFFSNPPRDALLAGVPPDDLLCFAVDLFEARGARPRTLAVTSEMRTHANSPSSSK